jgi:hypothetical protein
MNQVLQKRQVIIRRGQIQRRGTWSRQKAQRNYLDSRGSWLVQNMRKSWAQVEKLQLIIHRWVTKKTT